MQNRYGLDAGEGRFSSLDAIKLRVSGHPAGRLVTILTELQYLLTYLTPWSRVLLEKLTSKISS